MKLMQDNHQNCALVVDDENFLEGILTLGDIRRSGLEMYGGNPHTPKGDSMIRDVRNLLTFDIDRFSFAYNKHLIHFELH